MRGKSEGSTWDMQRLTLLLFTWARFALRGWAALGFSILEQRDLLKRAMIASNFNCWAQIFRTLFLLSDCDFPWEVERDQLTNKKRSLGLGNERGKSTVKLRVPCPACLLACVK